MFTGIILGQGEVVSVVPSASDNESRLTIRPLFDLPNIVDGESIAVNGACLTVEKHEDSPQGVCFTAYASAETLARTTLGTLRSGSLVNLERALAAGDRLGGHLVSGHVDCVATVKSVSSAGQSRRCRIGFAPEYKLEIIGRGSVALDGISLTVTRCGADWLEVNVIPETQARTSMGQWKAGSSVNLETDLIGKYVCQVLGKGRNAPAPDSITMDLLSQAGFVS